MTEGLVYVLLAVKVSGQFEVYGVYVSEEFASKAQSTLMQTTEYVYSFVIPKIIQGLW